ncbi:MauE/DoxX family redox-associated membrane protein [Chitinophaga lutea]
MKQKDITLPKPHRYDRFQKIFIEIVAAVLIIVWFHTGISKLFDHMSFSIQMQQSPIFHKFAPFVTYAGPIFEIILGILLVFKKTRLIGFLGSTLLMSFFTWYVAYLMIKLPTLPCSCGGAVKYLSWPQHLAFNISLTLLAFIATFILNRLRKIK